MRKTILFVFAAIVAGSTFAQTSEDGLRVWENNVITYQAPVDNIDSITFVSKSAIGESLIGDLITSVTPIMEGGVELGYTFTFLHNSPINIYNGKDGINGTNGNDGITPLLKIEEDYWFISYDDGETWTQLGKAKGDKGDKGDSMFQSVTQDEHNVYLNLTTGAPITITKTNSDINGFEQMVKDNLVKSLTVSPTIDTIMVGEQISLIATTLPFSDSRVTWSCDNGAISVSENGVISGDAMGIATVTAQAGDKRATCTIYIKPAYEPVFSVSANNKVQFVAFPINRTVA